MEAESNGMQEILAAVGRLQQQDRSRGRAELLALWERCGSNGSALEVCTLAHFLADTETDAALELEWDLRALEAATGDRGASRREPVASVPVAFLASLHLNVGDCLLRAGEVDRAEAHARAGLNAAADLKEDGYGRLTSNALRSLCERIDAARLGDEARQRDGEPG
ncbi:MAG: hypothetical protein V4555_19980 [Acidobacteriota bacterium]